MSIDFKDLSDPSTAARETFKFLEILRPKPSSLRTSNRSSRKSAAPRSFLVLLSGKQTLMPPTGFWVTKHWMMWSRNISKDLSLMIMLLIVRLPNHSSMAKSVSTAQHRIPFGIFTLSNVLLAPREPYIELNLDLVSREESRLPAVQLEPLMMPPVIAVFQKSLHVLLEHILMPPLKPVSRSSPARINSLTRLPNNVRIL